MEEEIVYGTHEDSHVVMSDRVQALAGSIYQELEKMIEKYDENVVKDLMPLVVNVLESLDLSYSENQEHQVELELLREDNEQLVTQYEREKQLRKASDQKLLEVEDLIEAERKEKGSKIESLESIVRMLELKAKNSSDHVYRLEEKEQEMKKEYSKLHERYTELFKTHMDHLERTKILMGTGDRMDGQTRQRMPTLPFSHMNRSSGPVSFGFQSLENNTMPSIVRGAGSPGEFPTIPSSPPESNHSTASLRNELEVIENTEDDTSLREVSEKGWSEALSPGSKDPSPDSSEECPPPPVITTPVGRSTTKKEQRSANTLYQELSFQDAEALGEMDEGADITGGWVHPGEYASSDSESELDNTSVNDNFFGMGKEVENLIMENNELLATKNALNIVKDDLIIKVDELTSEQEILREEKKLLKTENAQLQQRLAEKEEELKRVKEEAEKQAKSNKSDDEEDVPMAQRKRFTRVEMARVLMERNQYKERFMELQEAVRFTEMMRASRNNETDLDKKSKQSVWKFFSSLFSSNDREIVTARNHHSTIGLRYNKPTRHISPALDTMRKKSLHERKRGLELSDSGELNFEKIQAKRAGERREQLRSVQAHVRKDDGRLHAYGWSLPAKSGTTPPKPQNTGTPQVPVPVPVYCRPLMEKEDGMKVWCATGVNLAGGRTQDGGEIVGASVFYSKSLNNECETTKDEPISSPVEQLEKDIEEGERQRKESQEQLSSLVWICTSARSNSHVTVIEANNPADILLAFRVCQSYILCIASVPGACEGDYPSEDEPQDVRTSEPDSPKEENCEDIEKENEGEEEKKKETEQAGIGKITFVSCATGSEDASTLPPAEPPNETAHSDNIEPIDTNANELPGTPLQRRLVKEYKEGLLKDGVMPTPTVNDLANEELEKASSILPTMWLGAQNGCIFVHSAVSNWKKCLHSIKLKDAVLSIVHVRGRVLCSVADCTVAIFRRGSDGQWDLNHYHIVHLGPPQQSMRCLLVVHNKVWCGYKNKILVLDPQSMAVQKTLDVHPRKESHVKLMAWVGDGVWVSIRLDSTLRLYHAHTYEHLQDVDIEPYVSKMLAVIPSGAGKLGFSFVRITALLISCSRLWIGTGNGVIISVPLSESGTVNPNKVPGAVVNVFADPATSHLTPASFVPYCSMQHAQLSFHGHRDSVKFFVAVPGCGGMSAATATNTTSPIINNNNENDKPQSMLVMSGGEGYIDFRVVDDGEEPKDGASHLIVWQLLLR
ncbi:JNK-interacting protein 3 isoform X4 [Cimex lectularius]|uniref:JNK-interacting protein 3 n=1 Tax=Cimex lectularius TaxID=79782 RepID=A0A8I6RBT6_CIMLE|nr:JNK-interacting protein 3 isoform X4 [Cimex lectularius]